QRNRNFFGEQGRKRMADIRMLIGSSATSVVQGLRGHLAGNVQNKSTFGSPRPVSSWSTSNITGRLEPSWDHIANPTLLLQQQLQEARGEIKPAVPPVEVREALPTMPAVPPTPTRSSTRIQAQPTVNATNGVEHHVQPSPVPVGKGSSSATPTTARSTT